MLTTNNDLNILRNSLISAYIPQKQREKGCIYEQGFTVFFTLLNDLIFFNLNLNPNVSIIQNSI
jgi:hypothetical protein